MMRDRMREKKKEKARRYMGWRNLHNRSTIVKNRLSL